MENPVTTASGTFGSGREYGELIDLNRLGAITVKGVSEEAWKGNPVPRLAGNTKRTFKFYRLAERRSRAIHRK